MLSAKKIKDRLVAKVYNKAYEVVEDKILENFSISGVASLEKASGSEITFFSGKEKHKEALLSTKSGACLISDSSFERLSQQRLDLSEIYFFVVKDLNFAYANLMIQFYSEDSNQIIEGSISENAFIADSAVIGENCQIMPGSYIGKDVKIGDNVKIYPHVFIGEGVEIGNDCTIFHAATVLHSVIGKNTVVHSGARIGKDGFRYVTDEAGKHLRVPHIGQVIIGDDVEIGCNSTIDRGSISDTIIGDMCKLDNLVQIGHNVTLGKGCFIVAQVGIAGSVTVGDYVAIGGQGGLADNLSIGNYAKIAAQSGVMKDVLEKEIVMGSPAQPIKDFFKQVATMRKITKKEKI